MHEPATSSYCAAAVTCSMRDLRQRGGTLSSARAEVVLAQASRDVERAWTWRSGGLQGAVRSWAVPAAATKGERGSAPVTPERLRPDSPEPFLGVADARLPGSCAAGMGRAR